MASLAITSKSRAGKHPVNRLCAKLRLLAAFIVFAAAFRTAGCRGISSGHFHNDPKLAASFQQRDWTFSPAVVERDTPSEVVPLGDVHGGYKRLVKLLAAGGLIAPDSHSPAGYSWAGGDRTLVC